MRDCKDRRRNGLQGITGCNRFQPVAIDDSGEVDYQAAQRLASAMIYLAVVDAIKNPKVGVDTLYGYHPRKWVFSDDTTPGSFLWACSLAGIEPDWVRGRWDQAIARLRKLAARSAKWRKRISNLYRLSTERLLNDPAWYVGLVREVDDAVARVEAPLARHVPWKPVAFKRRKTA